MGLPGIHHARIAARGSTHKEDARNHTTIDPGPLRHTEPHAHDARPLGLALRVVRFPAREIIFRTMNEPYTNIYFCRLQVGLGQIII